MKKLALVVLVVGMFFAVFPLSWSLADHFFFTHTFQKQPVDGFVAVICPDRVEMLRLSEVSKSTHASSGAGCTFNITPDRQRWVEQSVRVLRSPGDSAWLISVKQLGEAHQQVTVELMGDGIFGMVYDVHQDTIFPLRSRQSGPGGSLIALGINLLLWPAACCSLFLALRFRTRFADNRTAVM